MPDDGDRNAQTRDPNAQIPVVRIMEDDGSKDYKERTHDLQKDIRDDQRWLKRIGIAAIVINVIIAYIYIQQLGQMRLATDASTRAIQLAQDSLDLNQGNFDRNMRQIVHQTASQAISAEATQRAAKAAKDGLSLSTKQFNISQRPFLVTDRVEITGDLTEGKDAVFQVRIKNGGKTTAIDAVMCGDTRSTTQTNITKVAHLIHTEPMEVGADEIVGFRSNVAVPFGFKNSIITKSQTLYIQGMIVYQSSFTKERYYLPVCERLDSLDPPVFATCALPADFVADYEGQCK